MRKRAQMKTPSIDKPQIIKEYKTENKKITFKKNWWIAFSLITIFFMVLFLNSYFNIISEDFINLEGDSLTNSFYLSGPDPYYNMRLVEKTAESGQYAFYEDPDPFLNYPLGQQGQRAPLLNMMAIGFSRVLTPFMSESNALGYSMQFVPALFGALLIFPVYFIGKTLFGKKEGLIGALLIAIIPLHIGSGHGSAYGLFDHDSFNLLLFFLTFLFLIFSIKDKNTQRSILFALLSGISLAALNMVWVKAEFLFAVIAAYAIVQMIIDIFNNKVNWKIALSLTTILFTGYLVSLPVRYALFGFELDIQLLLAIGVAFFGLIYLIVDKKKIPWIISLPSIFCIGGIAAAGLYFINDIVRVFPFLTRLTKLSTILFGTGVYGRKVDITIAEAGTYGISRSVMSYGPAIYWLAWFGFVILIYYYFKQKERRDYLFIAVLFLINIWLAGTAGRFLNDMVPLIAILAGWIIWFVVVKVDYKQMLRNIRNAGGGLRGIRRGIKIYHILGILFITLLIILPNAYLALDAAVPSAITKNGTSNMKIDYFGTDHGSAFGSSSYKERYWIDAFNWLNKQDSDIGDPNKKPAFISWWDYGFYEATVGGHPTVADNFQDGIPTAANFHTAKSEEEGVAVWIVRLLEGNIRDNGGKLSNNVSNTLYKHIDENNTKDIIMWIENPTLSPSYNTPIGEEYDKELSKDLFVGEQWPENAYYHDITEKLINILDDEEITWLYHDIQKATGYSIRYYGVEGYDVDIFNIFAFLGDKSLVLHALRSGAGTGFPNPEDDFLQVKWAGYRVNDDGTPGQEGEWTAEELNSMTDEQRSRIVITDTPSERKSDYFKTMFYRTYIGNIPEGLENQVAQLPCWDMRHFYAEYVSFYPYYNTQRGAVVIAKYYEGAKINGSIQFQGEPLESQIVVQKKTPLNVYGISFPVDHDKNETKNGTFSLIAPVGNITLQVRRNTELGINAFVMKTITFNDLDDPEWAPISEEEAMRKQGTNYERTINITIEPASIEGFAYENIDSDDDYNASIDKPLKNTFISLIEVAEFDSETGQPSQIGAAHDFATDDMGYYQRRNLKPGIYVLHAEREDEFTIHEGYVFIHSGNNTYNFSKPKPAKIEGVVYFDTNNNNEYDTGEELSDVTVPLIYLKPNDVRKLVEQVRTDITGRYSFSSLLPGTYILNPEKFNTTTHWPDYSIEEKVELKENESKIFNVSMDYAQILIQGYAKYEDKDIDFIKVEFLIDESVAKNKARQNSVGADETGRYNIRINPGYYNVSVNHSDKQGIYSFEGSLYVKIGESPKWYNISLIKHSYTITGSTIYAGSNIGDIKIQFSPALTIINNTAKATEATSDANGSYVVELLPGIYDVVVDEIINESGRDVLYKFKGTFEAKVAESFDIILTREETP